jgi:trimeric autotransporter adhesin
LTLLVQQQGTSRLLTRLTLKGNLIWGLNDATTFLDGEAFGIVRNDPDGAHIGLRLPPSGNGKRGGDFELFFWLTLAVRPSSLGLSPNPVDAGATSTGLITLNGPAPSAGAVIALSSVALDASGAQVPGVTLGVMPASVTIPAGQTTGNFTVSQTTVPGNSLQATLQITAAYAGNSVQAGLIINRPLGLTSLTFAPVALLGGNPVTGTLTLSGAAPANGAVVTLASNNALAKPPASVTIPPGQTSTTFTLIPGGLPINAPPSPVQVTAGFNGKSVQGGFTIFAPKLA